LVFRKGRVVSLRRQTVLQYRVIIMYYESGTAFLLRAEKAFAGRQPPRQSPRAAGERRRKIVAAILAGVRRKK